MPTRVMYVVDHLKIGGAQTHLVQLLSRLDRRRFHPMVCALKAHGELVRTVEEMGVAVFDGGLGRTLMGPGGARVLGRLTRLLGRERVDVAHAYLFHPNVLTPIAGRLARSAFEQGGSWKDIASSLRITPDAARRAYDKR